MEKVELDSLLTLIELNKRKAEVLEKIKDKEIEGKLGTDDFYDLVDLYKIVCSSINKKLDKLSSPEKDEIVKKIIEFNPTISKPINLEGILSLDKNIVLYKRLLVDLGCCAMRLYANNNNDVRDEAINYLYSLLGLEEKVHENNIDSTAVNEYMLSDFTNVLFTEINKFLNRVEGSVGYRKTLYDLKYRLILFSKHVETKCIIDDFIPSEKPRLIDERSIRVTGIEYDEYLDKLDTAMISWLDELIKFCLYYSTKNEKPVRLIDLVFVKALASTINDKNLLDLLKLESNNVNSDNYVVATKLLEEIINFSRENQKENMKIRSYSRI